MLWSNINTDFCIITLPYNYILRQADTLPMGNNLSCDMILLWWIFLIRMQVLVKGPWNVICT